MKSAHPSPRVRHSVRSAIIAGSVAVALVAGGMRPEAGLAQGSSVDAGDHDRPRGLIVAVRKAALTTDLATPVAAIGFREGEAFQKGDVLVSFDCRRGLAELRAAKAQRAEAQLTYENNAYLAKRNAIGTHDVKVSQVRLDKAEADVDAIAARLAQCTLAAPFAGVVSKLAVNAFEMPTPGKPFMEIVSNEDLEIALIVPSKWLGWLRTGTAFDFDVDELGTSIAVETARVGAVVDPVSQTVEIYARTSTSIPGLRAGMSGSARFPNYGG